MRPLPGLDNRSFSARRQRTGLLIHPEAHVPLSPQMSSISTISGQICLKTQTVCVHMYLFHGTLELSWPASSVVFPNICVHWPPLPSSSRAWAWPTSWSFSRPFRQKSLLRKYRQDSVQTSSCLRDLGCSLIVRSEMLLWKVSYLKGVTDTWISALPIYVRGFPEGQTCSLY